MNPLQREHADLSRRAAWRGKTTNLTAGRQDPVAGDDSCHRILGHGLTDIPRSFWPGAKFLRQGARGRRAAPSDPPRRSIDLLEERVLPAEVELKAGKIRLLALEIALHGGDCLDHLWRRRAAFRAGQPTQQSSFGRFRAFCRQLKARDTHVVPGDAAKTADSFEDEIMMRCLAHHIALAFDLPSNS